MKIVIVGPGALGCLFAAFLSKSKEDIWLLDKDRERAGLLTQQGITIEGIAGTWEAPVKTTASPEEIGPADVVVICVKAYDTKEAITRIKPLCQERTQLLTLQNGIGNIEVISEMSASDNVIGGVTSEGATLIAPGHIRYAGKGETLLGRMDAKIPVELRGIREVFNRSGFDTRICRDIKGLLWSKLIVNVGINALTALTRLPNGKLLEFEGSRRIMREAVTEAVRIAKRKRIKLIYEDPLAKVEGVCEATATNVSSMLQDVLRHKRTEADYINGVIVRLGQELGIPVPTNRLLVDLIKTIEASYCACVA